MPSFEEFGLREELLRVLEDEDIEQPTALQEAVIPVLRRGGNLVARASTGAGKTLAYGLGVLDRLGGGVEREGEEEVRQRLLVLVPTPAEAERVAGSLFPYVQAVGLSLTVPGGTWGTPPAASEILVAPAADLLGAVRSSSLKLEGIEAVVVDGASTIQALGDWEAVDSLLDLLPRDAQRIVVSPALPEEVEDLIERRVKRALRYPSEPALPEEQAAPPTGQIGYVLVPAQNKLDILARQLSAAEEKAVPPVIFCRTDERAAELAEQLSVRGFVVGGADDAEADVAVAAADATREELAEEAEEGLGQTISFDVPADARTLLARHGGDADAVVMVEPRELPHLREIGKQARLRVRAVPLPVDAGATSARLNAFRDELRRALAEEDLSAQMLVLEPLFEEFTAPEIAAAAAALLRRRPSQPQLAAPAAPAPSAPAAAPRAAPQRGAETGPAPTPWARLYVGVGSRDEIRPGDLVGAIAGEANIPGSKVGKIEIRDTFSIVEVQADVADQVIRSVNGTTLKGRSVRVDYDRGGDRGRKEGRPPARRQSNRPDRPGGAGGAGGPGAGRRMVRRPKDRE